MTACALLDDDEARIDWHHLPDDLVEALRAASAPPRLETAGAGPGGDDRSDLRAVSERTVRQAVQASAGNLSDAARRLGISRNTLYRKLGERGLR